MAVYFNNKTLTAFKNTSTKISSREEEEEEEKPQLPQQSNCHKFERKEITAKNQQAQGKMLKIAISFHCLSPIPLLG